MTIVCLGEKKNGRNETQKNQTKLEAITLHHIRTSYEVEMRARINCIQHIRQLKESAGEGRSHVRPCGVVAAD